MNLYPSDEGLGGPLAPADWTMSVGLEGQGESALYFADIQRGGNHVCRLAIVGAKSKEEAHRQLAVKARLWIAEYLARPRTGITEFGSLEQPGTGTSATASGAPGAAQ
ncbi:hypothetical protein ACSFA8_19510 [Variovorax sp. RT4R15]|uniref:hypothetical protein n=1 Tax=Variovorax sp. RT4R15 TaxID=3443737 RepID=UPI003F45F149